MVLVWADVSIWESARLDDAAGAFWRAHAGAVDVRCDVERVLAGFASEGEAAEALRASLRKRIGVLDDLVHVFAVLAAASVRACAGVGRVRSLVSAAVKLADSYGLIINADGRVGPAASWRAPWSYSDQEAAQLQAVQIGEVEELVAKAMLEAEEVDADYSRSLRVDEGAWGLLALLGAVSPGAGLLVGAGLASGIVGDGRGDQSWWWSRASRRGARRGRFTDKTAGSSSQGTANSASGGLGDPVWGTHAPIPPISPWQYQGDTAVEGSGQHNQRAAGVGDYAVHEAATSAANVMAPLWPDASKNLLHFLDNTGTPLDINVDNMLNDLPDFQNDVSGAEQYSVRQAIAAARNSGFDAPVTYPFTTDWFGHYAKQSDDANWFYATGGFSYALAGTVTVYPPDDASSGVWRHEVNYEVHVADRYNWDGSKQTQIGPFTVTDAQLQELHRAGIAQEYDLVGCSSVRSGQ